MPEFPQKTPEAQLFRAIDRKDIPEIKKLLNLHNALKDKFNNTLTPRVNLENLGENDFPPLHRACMGGSLEIVKLLLANGAPISSINGHHGSALSVAAINNHTDIVDELLARGFDMKAKHLPAHANALCQAILHGRREMALYLLQKGADPLQEGCNGQNGLITAAGVGAIALVEAILGAGITIDAIDEYGHTALMGAVRHNEIRMVEYLLDQGAAVNVNNPKSNITALGYAARSGNVEIATLLLARGADPHIKNGGLSPYESAEISLSRARILPVFDNWREIRKAYLDAEKEKERLAQEAKDKHMNETARSVFQGTAEKMMKVKSITFKKK